MLSCIIPNSSVSIYIYFIRFVVMFFDIKQIVFTTDYQFYHWKWARCLSCLTAIDPALCSCVWAMVQIIPREQYNSGKVRTVVTTSHRDRTEIPRSETLLVLYTIVVAVLLSSYLFSKCLTRFRPLTSHWLLPSSRGTALRQRTRERWKFQESTRRFNNSARILQKFGNLREQKSINRH